MTDAAYIEALYIREATLEYLGHHPELSEEDAREWVLAHAEWRQG